MKFIYADLGIELRMKQGLATVFQVEHPKFAGELIADLQKQIAGEEGKCMFVDSDKEVSIAKQVECVWNPFALDFSSKKIQNKLYKELHEVSTEYNMEGFFAVQQAMFHYLDLLVERLPYSICYDDNFDENAVFRMADLQITHTDEGLADNVVSYVKVMYRLCGVKVFVFLNLASFLTAEQWELWKRELQYLEIYVLCIEVRTNPMLDTSLVVDSDLCVI